MLQLDMAVSVGSKIEDTMHFEIRKQCGMWWWIFFPCLDRQTCFREHCCFPAVSRKTLLHGTQSGGMRLGRILVFLLENH